MDSVVCSAAKWLKHTRKHSNKTVDKEWLALQAISPGSWSVVCGTVVEVMQPSRKPCASARRERMCCGAEATQDMPYSMGVDKVEHAGENPCTCVSERVSILPVHMYG